MACVQVCAALLGTLMAMANTTGYPHHHLPPLQVHKLHLGTLLAVLSLSWLCSHSPGSALTLLALPPLSRLCSHSAGSALTLLALLSLSWLCPHSPGSALTLLALLIVVGWPDERDAPRCC